MKNLTFILGVRYPTEKAYGVTTEFTLRAIQDTQTCSVTLITPNFDKKLESNIRILEIKLPLSRFYDFLKRVYPNSHPLLFNVWKLIYPFKLLLKICNKNNLIWTREIYTSLIFRIMGFQTLCEIHRTPSYFDRIFLRLLSKFPNSYFSLISEALREKLKIPSGKSIILPMSVNQDEIVYKSISAFKKQFVVGYVGSHHSSGRKLSLDCIQNASLYFEKYNDNVSFQLIGIERKMFDHMYFPKNVEFFGRLPRENILHAIDNFDIGLVIYPESDYFVDSFPIKIVEYAARGVPILASHTTAQTNILGKTRACYFDLNSNTSLIESIQYMMKNIEYRVSLSQEASQWVENLTYQNRAKIVLGFNELWDKKNLLSNLKPNRYCIK
jgi:glycosyltransferase involved in cell wall biosynthesis